MCIRSSVVIKVWEELLVRSKSIGDMGYCDLCAALEKVGVEVINDCVEERKHGLDSEAFFESESVFEFDVECTDGAAKDYYVYLNSWRMLSGHDYVWIRTGDHFTLRVDNTVQTQFPHLEQHKLWMSVMSADGKKLVSVWQTIWPTVPGLPVPTVKDE